MDQISCVFKACKEGAYYVYPNYNSNNPNDTDKAAWEGLVRASFYGASFAKDRAESVYPTSVSNGKGDALRHALWSALMCFSMNPNSFDISSIFSKTVSEAYERLATGVEIETVMDLANGTIGRRLAKQFLEEYPNEIINFYNQQNGDFINIDQRCLIEPLSLFIENEIEAGNLCVIRNGSITPSNLSSVKVPIEISTIYDTNSGNCNYETGFVPGPLFAPISLSIESDSINIHKDGIFTKYNVNDSNLDDSTKTNIKELLSLIKSKTNIFQYFAFDGNFDFNMDMEPNFSWSQGVDIKLLVDINMQTDFYAIESLAKTLGKCDYKMLSWNFQSDIDTNFNVITMKTLAVLAIALIVIITLLASEIVASAAIAAGLSGIYIARLIDYFRLAPAL